MRTQERRQQSPLVTDHRTLRAMERAGFIIRNGTATQRERHWSGLPVRVVHVTEGPRLAYWNDVFTYHGAQYRLCIIEGCFEAFVCRVGLPLPQVV